MNKSIADVTVAVTGGGTPARDKPEFWKGNIPWATVKDVKEEMKYLQDTEEHITELGLRSSAENTVDANSLVVCTRMAVGRSVLTTRRTAINQDLKCLKVKADYNVNFIYYQINRLQDKIEGQSIGSTVKGISVGEFKKLSFFCPADLPTQRKIARILSTIDGQIEKTEAIIAKYQAVKQGILQDLFTRGIDVRTGQLRPRYEDAPDLYQDSPLGMIPKEWEVKQLKEVSDYVDYRGKTPTKSDAGIFLVTAKNVKVGYIDYEISQEYVPEETFVDVMSRGLAEVGDVLITTEAPMGNVAQVDKPYIALAQRVIKYRGKTSIVENGFLRFVLMSRTFQDALMADSSGSTVTGIKGSRLHKMKIIVPNIAEQRVIESIAKSQEKKLEVEHNSLYKLQLLKQGLMQDLLSGKVEVTA